MKSTDHLFAGSIPELYETHFVPAIFEAPARDLAARIAGVSPRHVLETAAGTGALTRELVARLPDASVVATDLNQPMLDRAMTQLSLPHVTWQQADALALPFDEHSFDVVVCQFGVMFFPEKIAGYREARRVLKAEGQFFFNVWDRIAENEFADVVTQALAEVFPDDPPQFMARTPHGYHDVDQIRAHLAAAGFTAVGIDAVSYVARARSALDLATAFCQGTPLRNEIEARDPARLSEATARAAEALRARFGAGALEGRTRAYVVCAG